ncbi:unnamed protein product [Ceutorhynchus assimilis]|uniref:TIL domain-containing protein n=1 Tax=Ceutorhynchus assimilis TaxID=467358 RepID=A0A9N9MM77_9CUCU|nr:unnamed protein product [Ceutorhynchus assimilis]
MNFFLPLVCVFLINYATASEIKCGPNEYLNTCASYCDEVPTCQNPYPIRDPNIACPAVCVERCTCIRGYIMNNGKCIRRERCPKC